MAEIKKKTILFGAGTESSCFSSGSQFLVDVLGIESKKMNEKRLAGFNNAIAKYIQKHIHTHSDFYPKFTKEAKLFGLDELYEICVRNYYLANADSKNEVDGMIESPDLHMRGFCRLLTVVLVVYFSH